jgi:hypothetical protein
MLYPSKKDWYVVLLIPGMSLAMIALGCVLLYEGNIRPNAQTLLFVGGVPILIGLLLLWIFCWTSCEISPPDLIIRSGPVRWPIPLDSLVEVRCHRGISAAPRWNFALSEDKVVIQYRKPNGRIAPLGIAVSPDDKEGFLLELRQAVPGLTVIGEGGERT